jgi:hypothetical protein
LNSRMAMSAGAFRLVSDNIRIAWILDASFHSPAALLCILYSLRERFQTNE